MEDLIVSLIADFAKQCTVLFPDDKKVKEIHETFIDMQKNTTIGKFKRSMLFSYLNATMPKYEEAIAKRDEKFILTEYRKIPYISDIPIAKYWKSFEPVQKEGIWDNLSKLSMYVKLNSQIPPAMMRTIKEFLGGMMNTDAAADSKDANGQPSLQNVDFTKMFAQMNLSPEQTETAMNVAKQLTGKSDESQSKLANELLGPIVGTDDNGNVSQDAMKQIAADPATLIQRVMGMKPEQQQALTQRAMGMFNTMSNTPARVGALSLASSSTESADKTDSKFVDMLSRCLPNVPSDKNGPSPSPSSSDPDIPKDTTDKKC